MGQMGEKMDNKKKGGYSSMHSIFRHADAVDKVLMIFGLFGAIGDGCSTPFVLLITGRLMNNVGGASSNAQDAFLHNINKVLKLIRMTYTYMYLLLLFSF